MVVVMARFFNDELDRSGQILCVKKWLILYYSVEGKIFNLYIVASRSQLLKRPKQLFYGLDICS